MNREQKLKALSVEYKVDFGNGKKNIRTEKKLLASPPNLTHKLPHITRLLALAHHLQDLLDQGVVQDYADIARLSGLTRARVSQIMNLALLAPQIQENILLTNNKAPFLNQLKENALRIVLKSSVWQEQLGLWGDFSNPL